MPSFIVPLCNGIEEDPVSTGREALQAALGAEPPAGVQSLPAAVLTRLAGQIDAARTAQSAKIDESVREAVTGVPLPVRGIVRKALIG
jgi:hypothetical protein